ncbi:type II toxin-antitoxin system VapC family toxin [Candidatus Poriferisocius sp.]|uniref:type II toxin-antitoxin system VapC family toxin n=1 Tax=Candidatus Poriferisocius sp. TaxID=3101276 RepID=UPI003B01F5BF
MNLLLDTHVLLWWVQGATISDQAQAAIANPNNIAYVSAASIWEISIKRARGKLRVDEAIFDMEKEKFEPLSITHAHAQKAGSLPDFHRDPFDRMLIAQALTHELLLVTRDPRMELYSTQILLA